MSVYVLMAIFNGDVFLKAQLDSICSLNGEWQLMIRDDGSSDKSLEIISAYCEKFRKFRGQNSGDTIHNY